MGYLKEHYRVLRRLRLAATEDEIEKVASEERAFVVAMMNSNDKRQNNFAKIITSYKRVCLHHIKAEENQS